MYARFRVHGDFGSSLRVWVAVLADLRLLEAPTGQHGRTMALKLPLKPETPSPKPAVMQYIEALWPYNFRRGARL